MAKIIRHNGQFAHYAPGVIYDIGITDPTTNTRTPFYVGETSDPEERLKAHARAGKNADDESTLVYQTIKALDDAGVAWTMETLAEFGEEGPTDLEDEWIMKHLYDGYKLKNMKKGNANWMAEREACRDDMRQRSISSFRKYKEVLSIEEKQAEADRKHAEWMRQEEEKTNAWLREAARQAQYAEQKRLNDIHAAEVKRLTAEAYAELERQKQERLEKARIQREELEAEMAKNRAEQIRIDEENKKRQTQLRAEQLAKLEADRPAREARMKAEAEAKLQAEQHRIAEAQKNTTEQQRIAEAEEQAWIIRSDAFNQQQEQERVVLKKQATDSMINFENKVAGIFKKDLAWTKNLLNHKLR